MDAAHPITLQSQNALRLLISYYCGHTQPVVLLHSVNELTRCSALMIDQPASDVANSCFKSDWGPCESAVSWGLGWGGYESDGVNDVNTDKNSDA